jgi:hypothetical protein
MNVASFSSASQYQVPPQQRKVAYNQHAQFNAGGANPQFGVVDGGCCSIPCGIGCGGAILLLVGLLFGGKIARGIGSVFKGLKGLVK